MVSSVKLALVVSVVLLFVMAGCIIPETSPAGDMKDPSSNGDSIGNGVADGSPCLLKPDGGMCEAFIPSYYFDPERGCSQFIWGGCGGVRPFETLEACQEACGDGSKQITYNVLNVSGNTWMYTSYYKDDNQSFDHYELHCQELEGKFIIGNDRDIGIITDPPSSATYVICQDISVTIFFEQLLNEGIYESDLIPIEGVNAGVLMTMYPGFAPQDFQSVETLQGHYENIDGEIKFVMDANEPVHSAQASLSRQGFETLLHNVIDRLDFSLVRIDDQEVIRLEDVKEIVELLLQPSTRERQPKDMITIRV